LQISGSTAVLTGNTQNNLAFSGQSGDYITLSGGAFGSPRTEINATAAKFEGSSVTTRAQGLAVDDKITHYIDSPTLGFVRVQANNVFVTQLSDTLAGAIQRGVDVANSGDT